jgi:aldehyde:ferredoxin oxidoreductase
MASIPGYAGKLLEVDLSAGTTNAVDLDPKLARDYIGGRAMGVKLLWDAYGENWANIDPLGPDAILCLMAGPMSCFMPSKAMAIFKSPLSGGAMGSAVSGDWAATIRFAGYDGVVIKGKASGPVYLYVDNDTVEIRDASAWWGKDVRETFDAIRAEYPFADPLFIGPAGENKVEISSIMANWYRACGRGGSGAVMGSKNLKAVVTIGNGPAPELADPEGVYQVMDWARVETPFLSANMHEYGTTGGVYSTGNRSASEPVRNWQEEWHDEKQIQAQFFAAEQWVRRYWADYGCTVACSKGGRIKAGPYTGTPIELPDYEGGAYSGPNFGVFDINEISYLADRFDKWGLDVISGGNVVGWAAELYQRGILTAADLGGVELEWGNADAFDKVIEMVAKREGIGDTLAKGTLAASKIIGQGSEQYAVQVRGIELGAHGVRSGLDYTRGLVSYALSTQGGDHTSIAFPGTEMWYLEDTLVTCGFATGAIDKVGLLNAITGFGITEDELNTVMVPRWVALQRLGVYLAGWSHDDAHNPPRFYEPLPSGPPPAEGEEPVAGKAIDPAAEAADIQTAYAAFGYDERGIPTTETLTRLGLSDLESAYAKLR